MFKVPSATKRKPVKSAVKPRANAAEDKYAAETGRQGQQVYAIIILAAALFIGCVIFIQGVNVWKTCHEALFGLFGGCAFLCPLFLIYIALLAAFGKKRISIPVKLLEAFIFVVLISSAVEIFTYAKYSGLAALYKNGVKNLVSGGVIGAPGVLLVKLFGMTGAAITDILLLIVFFLLITGITLVHIYEKLSSASKRGGERRRLNAASSGIVVGTPSRKAKHKYNIDVDLGPSTAKKSNDRSLPEIFTRKTKPVQDNVSGLDDLVGKIAKLKEPDGVKAQTVAAAGAVLHSDDGEQQQIYNYPPVTLLSPADPVSNVDIAEELKANAARLVDTLRSFGVETRITDISRGPAVTRYELQPSAGVKISRITSLSDDISLNLASAGVRIEAPIPNKAAVGIEVPNKIVSIVHIREIIESVEFMDAKSRLTIALGRDIGGNAAVADICNMPHMLIAGATGSGKSVCINTIIISLLYKASPAEVRLLMIDPKIVELGGYNGIPHLLVPVVTEPRRAAGALNWAVGEMQIRYKLFADSGVRDIRGYNDLARRKEDMEPIPHVVIIIDELADLIMAAPRDVEDAICRLAQKARAAGMHLVIATQRPSVDVITGLIKANIPSRIAFAVSSQVDSRVILDQGGADKLLGRGDMLFWPMGLPKPTRLQGCFVTDAEVENVIDFVKRGADADYDENVMEEIEKQAVEEKKGDAHTTDEDDPMLSKAIECVIDAGLASTSLLQRRLKLGYARAARIVDEMEARGIVGPFEGSKPRPVLISRQQWLEMNTNNDR
jgi:S-DNA-T family DNA segregation ATPase FtsK/SpoIIIE